ESYRGIRPAPGYPACPEHTEKRTIWELLDVRASTGIELTESMAMWPGASVSGFYFSHPESRYFVVRRLGRDQVADYAARKGWSRAGAERWLAPTLGYDPEDWAGPRRGSVARRRDKRLHRGRERIERRVRAACLSGVVSIVTSVHGPRRGG